MLQKSHRSLLCAQMVSRELCWLAVLCMPNARQGALLFQPRWQWENSFCFHLIEPIVFPTSPIFTFHLNQLSSKKSIYYCRDKGREKMHQTEQMMHHGSANLLQTENKYRGIAGQLMGWEMGLLCLKSFHIMETFKGWSVKSAKSVEICQHWDWNDLTQWLLFDDGFFQTAISPIRAAFLQLFTLSPRLAFSNQCHPWAAHSLLQQCINHLALLPCCLALGECS